MGVAVGGGWLDLGGTRVCIGRIAVCRVIWWDNSQEHAPPAHLNYNLLGGVSLSTCMHNLMFFSGIHWEMPQRESNVY